jgi:hypothetical protein
MRSIIVMVVLLLLVSSGSFAADPPSGKEVPKKPEAADVQTGGNQKPGKDKPQPEWPRPYKPSEEISADSVVPFPADI